MFWAWEDLCGITTPTESVAKRDVPTGQSLSNRTLQE